MEERKRWAVARWKLLGRRHLLHKLTSHLSIMHQKQAATNTTAFFVHWKRWLELQRVAQQRAASLIQRYSGTYRSRKLADALQVWGETTRHMAVMEHSACHADAVTRVLLRFMVGGKVRQLRAWAFYRWMIKVKKTEVQTVTVRVHKHEEAVANMMKAIAHMMRQHALKSASLRFHTWQRFVQEEASRARLAVTVITKVARARQEQDTKHALRTMGHIFRKMLYTKQTWAWRQWVATWHAEGSEDVLRLLERIQKLQKDLRMQNLEKGERGAEILARWARRMLTSRQRRAFLAWKQVLASGHELGAAAQSIVRMFIPYIRLSVRLRQTRAMLIWIGLVHRMDLVAFAAEAAGRAAAAALRGASASAFAAMWAIQSVNEDPLGGFFDSPNLKKRRTELQLGAVNTMVMEVFEAMAKASGARANQSKSGQGPSMGLLQQKLKGPKVREFIFNYYLSKFGKSKVSEVRLERLCSALVLSNERHADENWDLARLCARCCGVALPIVDTQAVGFLLAALNSIVKHRPSTRSSTVEPHRLHFVRPSTRAGSIDEEVYAGVLDVVSPDDARRLLKQFLDQRGGETEILGELYDHMMRQVMMLKEPGVRKWGNTIYKSPQTGAELRVDKFLLIVLELYENTALIEGAGAMKLRRKRRTSLVMMEMVATWLGGRAPGWTDSTDQAAVLIQRHSRLWLLRLRIKTQNKLLKRGSAQF
jgi:hypothetical protein